MPVTDLERSTAFYRDTLGLEQTARARGRSSGWARTSSSTSSTRPTSGRSSAGRTRRRSRSAWRTWRARGGARGQGHRVLRRDVRHGCLPHGPLRRPRRQRLHAAPQVRRRERRVNVERMDFVGVPVTDRDARGRVLRRDAGAAPERARKPGVAGVRDRQPHDSPEHARADRRPVQPFEHRDRAAGPRRRGGDEGARGEGRRVPLPRGLRLGRLPHGVLRGPGREPLILHNRYAPYADGSMP